MSKVKTIAIVPPINMDGTEYTELKFTSLKVKHVRAMNRAEKENEGDEFASVVVLISEMTGVPENVLDEMEIGTLKEAGEIATSFLPKTMELGTSTEE